MATVIPMPTAVDDDALLHEVMAAAVARGLYVVIDRHGRALVTPILLPGMQKLYAVEKPPAQVAA